MSWREIFGEAWPRWPAEDLELIRQPHRLRRRQLLHAQRHALRSSTPGRCAPRRCGRSRPPTPKRAGRSSRRADRHAGLGQGALWQSAALRDRERRGVFRSADGAGRSRRRSVARRLPAPAHRSGSRGDARRASTCAAISRGRCSTISSGRSATRSASASCTSISRPRSARRRTARASIRASSRATGRC